MLFARHNSDLAFFTITFEPMPSAPAAARGGWNVHACVVWRWIRFAGGASGQFAKLVARGELDAAIEDAFPGSSLSISGSNSRLELSLKQNGMLRPLRAPELSDGTL